jgi:hypothetical protein
MCQGKSIHATTEYRHRCKDKKYSERRLQDVEYEDEPEDDRDGDGDGDDEGDGEGDGDGDGEGDGEGDGDGDGDGDGEGDASDPNDPNAISSKCVFVCDRSFSLCVRLISILQFVIVRLFSICSSVLYDFNR